MTDKEMPELKPCPFCGSKNIDPKGVASFKPEYRHSGMNWKEHGTPERIQHKPACDDCGATTDRDWNTRADLADELKAENEKLRSEKQKMMACIETHTTDGAKTTQCYDPVPIIEQQAAEIERLRGALRDSMTAFENMQIDICHGMEHCDIDWDKVSREKIETIKQALEQKG